MNLLLIVLSFCVSGLWLSYCNLKAFLKACQVLTWPNCTGVVTHVGHTVTPGQNRGVAGFVQYVYIVNGTEYHDSTKQKTLITWSGSFAILALLVHRHSFKIGRELTVYYDPAAAGTSWTNPSRHMAVSGLLAFVGLVLLLTGIGVALTQ